jgi:hypothetical protein
MFFERSWPPRETLPDRPAVLQAYSADRTLLSRSTGDVVRRGGMHRHRGNELSADLELGSEQILGPRMPHGHLDRENSYVRRVVIGQWRRRAKITVEGTGPAIVVQGVEQTFSSSYRTAWPPVAGRRGHMADDYARCGRDVATSRS